MNIFASMRIVFILCFVLLLGVLSVCAQTITGTFRDLAGKEIILQGFNGFSTYTISTTKADNEGRFALMYTPADKGMGSLKGPENKPFVLVLSGEDIELRGENFLAHEKIEMQKGPENKLFARYASEHPRREQALSAWNYLQKIYHTDSLFLVQKTPVKAIETEQKRIKEEDAAFLRSISPAMYVSWYFPVRKLLTSLSTVAQYRTVEIPATIAAFRKLDYTDPRLYKSGLLREAIEGHFWLIENSGKTLDSSAAEMKVSIDAMLKNLSTDVKKLNEITDYLFEMLEQHSLFQASEYLALKVLNEVSCTIDANLSRQLETYRAMKKGNTAPDVTLTGDVLAPGYEKGKVPAKVSDIKAPYTVVAFGASWCPKCREEFPEIARQYGKWKSQGVEVILFSLDEEPGAFKEFAKDFPFVSVCDYKKWNGNAVNNYYVFGTPTIFLLDNERKILLRPTSVKQMDAWVDWYLVQGNKR